MVYVYLALTVGKFRVKVADKKLIYAKFVVFDRENVVILFDILIAAFFEQNIALDRRFDEFLFEPFDLFRLPLLFRNRNEDGDLLDLRVLSFDFRSEFRLPRDSLSVRVGDFVDVLF